MKKRHRSTRENNWDNQKPASMHEFVLRNIERNKSINEALLNQFTGRSDDCSMHKDGLPTKTCVPVQLRCRRHPKKIATGDGKATKVAKGQKQTVTAKQANPVRRETVSRVNSLPQRAQPTNKTPPRSMPPNDPTNEQVVTKKMVSIPPIAAPIRKVLGGENSKRARPVRKEEVYLLNVPELVESRLLWILDFIDTPDDTDELFSLQSFESIDWSQSSASSSVTAPGMDSWLFARSR